MRDLWPQFIAGAVGIGATVLVRMTERYVRRRRARQAAPPRAGEVRES